MKFLLQCKHCGNKMQYETKQAVIVDQKKACVYCGKTFSVRVGIRSTIS